MTQPVPTPAPVEPAPTSTPTPAPAPAPVPKEPEGDKPLGPAGEKALNAERARVKELERQMAELSPLKQLAEVINGGQKPKDGKSEAELLNERFDAYEQQLATERGARWRAEIAAEKGLSAQQAARLNGTTREELLADADELLTLFPGAVGPRNPAPDPSQGARGGPSTNGDLEAQIQEATKAGDWRKAAALQKTKLANVKR
jgi:hypothetical protein